MSLFSIVKSVMDSNGWPTPITSVASASSDQNMRQSLALANKALSSISFKKDWPPLIREWSFSTVTGQMGYDLPPDFHHLVAPSAVNSDQYYGLKGSLTPIQWYRMVLNGGMNWATGFRIEPMGKKFNIAPSPGSPESLTFMYVTNLIVKDGDGNLTTRYSQDTDESLVDEDIVELDFTWRWREKKGLDYTAEMAESNGTTNRRFAQYLGYGELPIGGYCYDCPPLTNGNIGNGPIGV